MEQENMTQEMSSEQAQPEDGDGNTAATADIVTDDIVDNVEQPSAQTALETELQETRDKHLRLAAEFENFKKRTTRERSESIKFSNERILNDFLSIVDNLDRALQHAKEGSEGESLVQGVELVHKQCTDLLARFNVTAVDAVGAQFDPVVHQAVSQVETDEHPENTVADEFQRGYRLHDRLLRPALVTVAVPKSTQAVENENTES
ncbi:MAG TPA: nucleotide exchange factor GrpE [Nitrospirales bacterium]|nr:nucleotide exchange factor GrpE [Nitrospirales bacterium]HIN32398.1 nucleotide exchange factor GrpE [Nitrospirales bacterium]